LLLFFRKEDSSFSSTRHAGFRIMLSIVNPRRIVVQPAIIPRALGRGQRPAAILDPLFVAQRFVGFQVIFVPRRFGPRQLAAGHALVDAVLLIVEALVNLARRGLHGLCPDGTGCEWQKGNGRIHNEAAHDTISGTTKARIIAKPRPGCKGAYNDV
jgi:hypothetical protein